MLSQNVTIMFWGLLFNNDSSRKYRGGFMLNFITHQWSHLWIDETSSMKCYDNYTVEEPQYFFYKSTEILNLRYEIKSIKLSRLILIKNYKWFINILCPWGFTEFVHKFKHIDIYIFIQRFLRNSKLVLLND